MWQALITTYQNAVANPKTQGGTRSTVPAFLKLLFSYRYLGLTCSYPGTFKNGTCVESVWR